MIEKISNFLFKLLDKLKTKNMVLFLLVQSSLVAIAGMLANEVFVIPTPSFIQPFIGLLGADSLNSFAAGVLVAIIALTGVHTSAKVKQLNK